MRRVRLVVWQEEERRMIEKNMQPLDYAQAAVDTMMRKFPAAELPPKGRFC